MNPMKLLQLKSAWDRVKANHPKFPKYLSAVRQKAIREGTVIEFKVTRRRRALRQSPAEGRRYCSVSGNNGAVSVTLSLKLPAAFRTELVILFCLKSAGSAALSPALEHCRTVWNDILRQRGYLSSLNFSSQLCIQLH